MYALFAHIGGEWGFAGIDPHEECAVLFIDQINEQFGAGTAQVFKFPDKTDHNPTADAAEHHAKHASLESLKTMLTELESGSLNLDDALKNLNGK